VSAVNITNSKVKTSIVFMDSPPFYVIAERTTEYL